mgnify:FL=1
MNILRLLDMLEDEIENGRPGIFTGRVSVDGVRCMALLRDIRTHLPEAIEKAKKVEDNQQRILVDAQQEADVIVNDAERRMDDMVEEHELVQKAYETARRILENAHQNAKEIRLGAKEYADEMLEEVEAYLENRLETLRQNRDELNEMSL